jgi:hypothetical protein
MSIEIEKGIPVPVDGRWNNGGDTTNRTYPFPQMQVGDSLFSKSKGLPSSASSYRKKTPGWNYTSRIESGGFRIWCTATPTKEAK